MKISFVAALTVATVVIAAAQAASEQGLAAAILNCSAKTDEKEQLACYNGIAAQLKVQHAAATSAAPTGDAPADAQTPKPAQTTAEGQKQEGGVWYNPTTWFSSNEQALANRPTVGSPADFGNEDLPEAESNEPRPLDHIAARVASVSYNYFRRFTLTLDNGQVWRQMESDGKVARFSDDGGEAVTISRGFMGSFSLTIDGRWGSYQVKRIK